MSVRLTMLLFLLLVPPLQADQPWSLKKQVLLSHTIARGKVLTVADKVVDVTRDYLVKSYQAEVQLAELLKGRLDSKQFSVRYLRHIGKPSPFPEVTIRAGKEYLFYLAPGKPSGWEMISPYFGAVRNYYGLVDDIRALLARQPAATVAPRAAKQPAQPKIELPPLAPPQPVGGLLAIARVEQESVAEGQPLKLWLVLKNVGQRRIDLYFQTLDRFATFEIYRTAPQAAKLQAENPESPAPPQAAAYVPLEQGSYVYTSVPLSSFARLDPGAYQVRVRVELPELYAGKALGKQGWTGVVHSGWVRFNVTAAPAKKPAAPQKPRWRRAGVCRETHLGALEHGTCKRCGSRSSSKSKEICVFCADELGVCPFCLKKVED